MAPSDSYLRVLFGWYQVKASFFFGKLTSPIKTFQNNIGLWGFANGHHLYFLSFHFYDLWEGLLTNLALEFGKIVGSGNVINLFLHLAVDPLSEATNVNFKQRALALAGRYQGVLFSLLTAKAHFTSDFISLLFSFGLIFYELKHSIVLVKVISVSDSQSLSGILHFDHHVLHSSHLDNMPGFWIK